jgi:hypothetical protein
MKMLNDEIVDEVRAMRDAHAARFNYDLRAIVDDLKKTEAEHIAAGHPYVDPPVGIPKHSKDSQFVRFPHT